MVGSGGGAEVGRGGGTPGAGALGTGGGCMERPLKLDNVSSDGADFRGFGGLVADVGRTGLAGTAGEAGATGSAFCTGACGAEMYAADEGGGAVLALTGDAGVAVVVLGVPGPGAAPTGDLPLKQLSQTFCGAVLWMWGSTSFLVRWSEHTTLPHFLQWWRRIQKVKSCCQK